jgi:hypothetical protein
MVVQADTNLSSFIIIRITTTPGHSAGCRYHEELPQPSYGRGIKRSARQASIGGKYCGMTPEGRNNGARGDVARQRLGKHIFAATDTQAIIQELLRTMFSARSVQMCYNGEFS